MKDIDNIPRCFKCGCLLNVNEGTIIGNEWFCDLCAESPKQKYYECHHCGNIYFEMKVPEVDISQKKATDLVEIYCLCSLCKTKYIYQRSQLIKIVEQVNALDCSQTAAHNQ